MTDRARTDSTRSDPSSVVREDVDFEVAGDRCAAWLYRSRVDVDLPIIVMAHGFAGERTFLLPEYATAFARLGMAVFLFDYRHFGASGGEPRDLVDHRRQRRDWMSAIDHAKSLSGIRGDRVGLWGTSYSGGHVMDVAATRHDISAVVSQVPMVDAVVALRLTLPFLAAAMWHAARDLAKAAFGRDPHYVPVTAPPGTFAALNREGCEEGYQTLLPREYAWQNRVAARSLLKTLTFRPGRRAETVQCPVLVINAEADQVIRAAVIDRVAARLPRGEVLRYPVDHFGVYRPELLNEISGLQGEFLARHLLPDDGAE